MKRALQSRGAQVVATALEQLGFELADDLLHDRDVLVDELLLQIDRVRADDRLALGFQRVRHGGQQVGQRLADASRGFDHERSLLLQSLRHQLRHALLLRAKLKVLRLRERPALRERLVHALGQRRLAGGFENGVEDVDH